MGNETLFPHLTSTGPAPAHREVLATYRNVFAVRVAEGKLRPLVLPYHLYGFILLLIYLCIPHTKSPLIYAARWPVLVVILWFQWKTMWETSSMSMATAFAAGLISVWVAVLSVTWLLLCRPQFDVKRLERRKVVKDTQRASELIAEDRTLRSGLQLNGQVKSGDANAYGEMSVGNGSASTTVEEHDSLRHRTQANGVAQTKIAEDMSAPNGSALIRSKKADGDGEEYKYHWQPYPNHLLQRIDWVSDLLINFRGPGWNWAIPPMPALPPSIKAKLGESIDDASICGVSSVGLRRFDTRAELIKARIPQFVIKYIILDILKTILMKDPYYVFGPNTYDIPSHLKKLSPFQLNLFRQCLNTATVVVALEMAFLLAPLLFSLLLGPKVLGLRGEAWYYPTTWGSFSNILNKGLNGLWGGWWHQTFRFAFSAPSNYLIDNGYIKARSTGAKLCALFFAFGISGILHSGGSISQLAHTCPWHAPAFFMLQALGILLQSTICASLHPQISRLPKSVRQAGNLMFTWAWLFNTSWLLVDDFARGGLWMWEPLPISPSRALGYGVKGDTWWCWEHTGVGWYTGKHWWESGVEL